MSWFMSGFMPSLLETGIVALIASWVGRTQLGMDGRLIGVCVAIGMIFGHSGSFSLRDPAEVRELGEAVGAIVATLLLWLRWYKWPARTSENFDG